jgi:hypothetical protein
MGVFVVGMHRSGTSAVAAALQACGLAVGAQDDLMSADPGNPGGYFELRAIGDLNDELLAGLGGRWDSPPQLVDGWENDPEMTPLVRRAMTTRAARLPNDRWLVKDPRLTLLLPLWRRAVLDRCAAVLVVRNPMEVAWSVTLRNGIPTMTALALWSVYNRAALLGLGGLPVFVCRYDALIDDPRATVDEVVTALARWGELDMPVDVDAAATRVQPELRRSSWRRDAPDALDRPGEIDRLDKFLTGLAGAHDVFEPGVPPAAPWEQALLRERRTGIEQIRARDAQNDRIRIERDDLATLLEAASSNGARLDHELALTRAHQHEVEEQLRRASDELARTRVALAKATDRWERLERRLPVRVFRLIQRGARTFRAS